VVPVAEVEDKVKETLADIQESMFQRAKAERDSRIGQALNFDGKTSLRPGDSAL